MSETTSSAEGFRIRLRASVTSLPTGAFAFVMATGIVSNALDRIGWGAASVTLAVIAVFGLIALSVALAWRIRIAPDRVASDAGNPRIAFGFLTVVAAFDVVSVRLHGLGAVGVAVALLVFAALLWVFLGYGVPARLMLGHGAESAISAANGSWFLWVVSTQSIATAIGTIAHRHPSEWLAVLTAALWGIGVMLYLMLATLVTLRLLSGAASARDLNPSYWIYMGATAITVLAGSMVLSLPSSLPVVVVVTPVVAGLTFLLWAFGLWWIPLLVVFGVWRHRVHHIPLRYSTSLWSIVFPLGMFSVASMRFGEVENLGLMSEISRIGEVGAVVSFIVWAMVAVAMSATAVNWARRR